MVGDSSKTKFMIFLLFLMACYFIFSNMLDKINDKNENNSYVSLNVISSTKEEYIYEYISYIKDKKYDIAYNMLSDKSKNKFGGKIDNFIKYANSHYKQIGESSLNFKYNILNSQKLKKMDVYTYQILDIEDEDSVLIEKMKLNEYACNVYKIDLTD